eukprot:TRINITY_DN61_c0_g1_i4.p1 TRINITY_DN61_c0_g1~~TRINITY_DN61_c0_g1_i4.p1  ORF type:complete len:213 (+),score=77.47 TRINITY_DN61_c0_g1_i4:28-639(+)
MRKEKKEKRYLKKKKKKKKRGKKKMSVTYTLPENYGFVMAGAVAVTFHCMVQGSKVGREVIMSKEWVEKNLKEENKMFKEKYGMDIPKGAYPDMGDGRHCAKLSYKEWLEYASCQRAHGNYVEGLTGIVLTILVSGLNFPMWTVTNTIAYIVGRELYCGGYRKKGPAGRLRGIWFMLAMLLLVGSAFVSSLRFTTLGADLPIF